MLSVAPATSFCKEERKKGNNFPNLDNFCEKDWIQMTRRDRLSEGLTPKYKRRTLQEVTETKANVKCLYANSLANPSPTRSYKNKGFPITYQALLKQ